MSTLSIVTITVIAAFLIIFLIAAIAALVYVYIVVRRQLTAQIASFSLTAASIGSKFESQHAELTKLVVSIHGNEIQQAAKVLVEIVPKISREATRVEQACTAFRGALQYLTEEQEISGSAIDRARQSGLGPESYAPAAPDEHFVSRSRAAASDALDREEESADNTSSGLESDNPPNSFRTFGDQ